MSVVEPIGPEVLATVTVTFNPDLLTLGAQLRTLPEGDLKIIVDNASEPGLAGRIADLAARIPHAHLLRNTSNLGLAAAVNQGVRAVAEMSAKTRFVLLLDQDSGPQPGSLEALVKAFRALEADGHNVGCVGPLLRDPNTGLTHGFHQCTRWRWKRVYPPAGSPAPVLCANLNGSGTLVPVSLFLELGGLDEPLFIDHVDTEWAFRVLVSGYALWGIPSAVFDHRMGESSVRFWCLGWRIWPARSPRRHYFLYRNAVLLMRRDYVPVVWKFWASVKLCVTLFAHLFFDRRRFAQASAMLRGVRKGIHMRVSNQIGRAHV